MRLSILWRITEIEGIGAYLHRSIDVNLIFDSARLGLFSSENILQIGDVALRVVLLLFLPCF